MRILLLLAIVCGILGVSVGVTSGRYKIGLGKRTGRVKPRSLGQMDNGPRE
jgi:hypothetical protein